jgi:hypothetical protein
MAFPVSTAFGSTGSPTLATVNTVPSPTVITSATSNETVPAGHEGVTAIDGGSVSPSTNLLTIVFNGVTFSGGQFYLILSKDGFASASVGDIRYSPVFNTSDFSNYPLKAYTNANGTFYIGTVSGDEVVVGPVPILISSAYHFIKVYDGSTGAEAATVEHLVITPGITVTPTSGAAKTPVVIRGGGFGPSESVGINYTYTFYPWTGSSSSVVGTLITSLSTGPGWFTSASVPMVDVMQAYNPSSGDESSTAITLFAINATHISSPLTPTSGYNAPVFTEYSRYFHQVVSWTPTGFHMSYSSGIGTFGNDSGIAPILGGQPITTYVFSPVVIAGTDFAVSSPITFWIGSIELASTVSTTTSTGSFNTTVTIPEVSAGVYTLVVHNNGVNYTFNIDVYPTMIISPTSGTASNPTTTITISVYGFPAKITAYIYWNETYYGDNTQYNVVNITTLANGEINMTMPHTFVVPETYGGEHVITAFSTYYGSTFGNGHDYSTYNSHYAASGKAWADFVVLPSLMVTPGTFNSTYGGLVTAVGEGLFPGVAYSVNIDNKMADFALTNITQNAGFFNCHHYFWWETCTETGTYTEGAVTSANNGVLNLTFVGAGFSPGLHVISLTSAVENLTGGIYAPDIYAFFTVTPQGDWEYNFLTSINDSINGFTGQIQTLSNNVQTWINAAVVNINGHTDTQISTLSTNIQGWINTAVSDIDSNTNTQISTLSTAVQGFVTTGVSSVNSHTDSALTTISSDVSSTMTTVGTISTQVGGISGVSSQATNILNAVNTEQTYVLVVAVLAAIILVLVLAVLIRKLS